MDKNRRGARTDPWGRLTYKGWVGEEESAEDGGVAGRWEAHRAGPELSEERVGGGERGAR